MEPAKSLNSSPKNCLRHQPISFLGSYLSLPWERSSVAPSDVCLGTIQIRNESGSSLNFVNSKTQVYLGEGETIVFLLRMAPK